MSWLSHLARRAVQETIGRPIRLPEALLERYPQLAEAQWRVGGLPLRIGGWCLGQRSVAGFTLGETVFLAPDAPIDAPLLVHEVAHVRQFGQDKSFPIRYLWESLTKGYRNNRYELEADAFVKEIVWSKTPPRQL
jgi:hypothetical protein